MLVSIQSALEKSPEYQAFLLEEKTAERQQLDTIASSVNVERQKIAKAYAKLQKPFWCQPISRLDQKIKAANGRRDLLSAFYWDVLLRGTEEREGTQPSDPFEVFKTFVESMPAKTGFQLDIEGLLRFRHFVIVSSVVGGNLVNDANLTAYMQTLVSEEVFGANELSYDASRIVKTPEPVPVKRLKDIETADDSTPEGRLATKSLIQELANAESLPLMNEWFKSLNDNFNYFRPTKEDWNYIVDLFMKSNWSPLDARNYDAARRHMVKIGRWSTNLLTHEDIKSRAMDVLDLNDRDIRGIVLNGTKQALLDLLQRHNVSLI